MKNEASQMVQTLARCVAACNHCFNECLKEEDVQMMVECIKLDVECSDICVLAISSVSYEGNKSREILSLCAEVCDQCAAECAKHHQDHCQKCAEACRECAESCRSYRN